MGLKMTVEGQERLAGWKESKETETAEIRVCVSEREQEGDESGLSGRREHVQELPQPRSPNLPLLSSHSPSTSILYGVRQPLPLPSRRVGPLPPSLLHKILGNRTTPACGSRCTERSCPLISFRTTPLPGNKLAFKLLQQGLAPSAAPGSPSHRAGAWKGFICSAFTRSTSFKITPLGGLDTSDNTQPALPARPGFH